MEYRYIGNSGLRVSEICLGTMNFGATTSEAVARKMVNAGKDAGVNFIDTADVYAGGESEKITGKLIRRERADWVLASKAGQQDGPPERKRGLSRKWLMEAIDDSLKRLGTDYLDIYYMHHVDWDTPLEESIAAMGDIIASGKAHFWGFSNHLGWQVGEMARLCDQLGTPRPIISQPHYNLVMRAPENDLLPACEYYGIGVFPYSPLARGVLTGKYSPAGKPPANSRAGRGDASILNRDFRKETFQAVDKIRKRMAKRGMTPGDFAIRWVLNNALVTGVVTGPRTLAQWKGYLGALKHDFTAEDEAFADTLVAPGHASTPGFTWSRYAPRGRKPRSA
ncbi:MAG: aldo/keto reductase [Rhodospirillales bacterium]|jgi:aryl-alcohol dehydrogenase-like predicted oxidoreductase|nr:aldo/keto reductase [Rhodospirillales bacterium]MDP6646227.1 aldo/keto reductase [Rhodospirillales bacterium]MDP6841920.1 aldo/keto reductase [Rhodospirillales bacterium]|tara:strand:+ start:744 stop:1754 length:1011 start_codon:yes stop_codon:yes gene_type:complete